MKRILLLAFTHIMAVVLGATVVFLWLGFNAKQMMKEGNAMMTQVALVSRHADFVDVMRTNGTKEEYKEALLNFLTGIDEAVNQPSSFYDKKMHDRDKTLTYERLSRLEKEAGNIEKSDEYIKLATESCNNSGWKDCSAGHITMISKKLEDKSLNTKTTDKK
jgi:hypothetical protein